MRYSYLYGQGLSEYALILAIIFAAMISMQTYMKRGIQDAIKATADELGAPAEEYYQTHRNLNLGSQIAGVMEPGLVNYKPNKPLGVETGRNTTLTVTVSPLVRKTKINTDKTKTTGEWTILYKAKERGRFTASEMAKKPSGAESKGGLED